MGLITVILVFCKGRKRRRVRGGRRGEGGGLVNEMNLESFEILALKVKCVCVGVCVYRCRCVCERLSV